MVEADGYGEATVSGLCAKAGLSRQTFYTHFPDLRACITEAHDPELAELEARLRAAEREGKGWARPLARALDEALGEAFDSARTPRARLIRATIAEVARRGYAATGLGDITEAAGVARPDFYAIFHDRRACFAAAQEELVEGIESRITRAREKEGGLAARVSGSLAELAESLAREPATAPILAAEPAVRFAAAGRNGRSPDPRPLFALTRRLLCACADREPNELPVRIAAGGVAELIAQEVAAGSAASLPRLVPDLVYGALVPLLGAEAAIREMERVRVPALGRR